MIYFIYGEDTYRSRQKLREIIQKYREKNSSLVNLRFLDAGENDNTDLIEEALKGSSLQLSMLKEKKLLVILNPFSSNNFKTVFLKNKENLFSGEGVIVIFSDEKKDPKNELFKILEKKCKCQEFKPLSSAQAKIWIQKEVKERKINIDPSALSLLSDITAGDLWRFNQEIEKLNAFKNGRAILSGDVEKLVHKNSESNIFNTIDALASGNKKTAMEMIRKHIENGDHPLYLFSMIQFQFRNLIAVGDLIQRKTQSDAIVAKTGLHPFVVRKTMSQSRNFSMEKLKAIYLKLFNLDLQIKTGQIKPDLAIESFVASI